jgi:hypothetical protein
MKLTMDDLHRMDPAQVISWEGRPMAVNEVIQHLIHDDWPAEPAQKSTHQQES